ncbi:MAG: GNAT family N-acetyltransferase [Anaerolineae bacterium]|jgi:predicted GNAT superfamily acetyltransferase
MINDITIRLLESVDEFQACHQVQKVAWQFPDLLIIPYTQIITVQQNGGAVLGAFDGAELIGFVFGYLGRQRTRPLYLFSQRMGVLPAYQGKGIGERLKWAQRAWAVEQGLDRVLWTYDPLESPNAWLNITKLGGLARHYERDIYGQHNTPLHNHLPSDRLLVEWELLSERVLARLSADWSPPTVDELLTQADPPLNPVSWDSRGHPCSGPSDLSRDERTLLVEVPAAWQDLRKADMALAADWRGKTRKSFEHYLAQGYVVSGYASGAVAGRRRNVYQLEKNG